ncbi:hypothetical protein BDV40DRAFT_298453 [Aspergillus tamarii]|uniref:DinB-like domain-containing protein n=1 Tax=Aspergillus tamarii TaxID=41984 RepID=A0A5N6V0H0_ASPTM|nr:hypothetical protein BDV40DRAFT_298453 [Aspergillus tamarii]
MAQALGSMESSNVEMFPKEALREQPNTLRNPVIFYLGHIPIFEDIHLARATKPLQPNRRIINKFLKELSDTLDFREKVCARIAALSQMQKPWQDRLIGRALWIGFEHEGLHLEIFLWMTLMSPNILPPPDIPRPDFIRMAEQAVRNLY